MNEITNLWKEDTDENIVKSWLVGLTDGQTYSINNHFLPRITTPLFCGNFDSIEGEWDDIIGPCIRCHIDDDILEPRAKEIVNGLNGFIDRINANPSHYFRETVKTEPVKTEKEIITISETECGGKPTIYAEYLTDNSFDTLLSHMKKGLPNCEILDEDVDALKEQGYTWIAERYCVEVTEIGEGTETQEDRVVKFSPFKKLKVTAKVEWDGDEGDELPDPDFEVTFTADELKYANNCLNEDDDDPTVWNFYKDEFEEWFGEYLTSFTDFCHKGFTYTVQPMN